MRKSSRVFTTFGLLVILSMLLTACVAPAAPSGSTGAEPASAEAAATGELPVLDFYFVAFQYKDEDLAQVEAAANEILSKEISATVKFHPMTFTDAPTKGSLVLNSGEPCDLMVFSGFNPFAPAVTTGGLLPLDDLLPKYAPTVLASFPEEYWNVVKRDGKTYGTMNFQGGGISKAAFWARQDLMDKYGFDWQAATTPEAWEPYFDQIVANEEGVTPLISSDPFWGRHWWPNLYGYDPINTSVGSKGFGGLLGVKLDDPELKVVAVPWTDEYKQAAEMGRKWYEKGYYLKTPPADAEMISMRGDLKFGAFYVPFGGWWSTKAMADNEWKSVPIMTAFVQDKGVLSTGSFAGSIYGVCSTSQHPEEAVKFIEAVNTNPDLLNLLNYGIKDKHWVWADEANKVIKFPEGVDAKTVGWNPNTYWQFGDRRLMYLTSPDDIGVFDKVAAAMEEAIVSPLMGFTDDTSPVQNEIAQVVSAATQYCDPVDKGLVDVESGLKACQDALKAAGIDTIVAEYQKQIDAWAASK